MIPCHICGKDSGAHWVAGYVPAQDSQKMALCPLHDTPENRKDLRIAWHKAMIDNIRTSTRNTAYFAARGSLQMLTIHYLAGGSLSLPCLEASLTEHNTLKVVAPDGSRTFFPMGQISRYALSPMQGPATP